ncbi:MAG: hypothetical protein JKX78_12465 [Alteromonadaceae bacterium]|nr:hypothetical protein [Alteromonadaceae bacterium]
MCHNRYFLLLILLIFSSFSTLSAPKVKQGKLIKTSTLFAQASKQSKAVMQLKIDESVVIHKRQRAWYQITTQEKPPHSGWVNMLNIRFVGVSKRQGELGVAALLSSISNDTRATSSTGIRGFDEKDLANAKANMQQVALLDTYVVTQDSAIKFAKQGGLATKKMSNEQVKK